MVDRWEQARGEVGRRLQALLEEAGVGSAPISPVDWWALVPRAGAERPLQVYIHLGDYTLFFSAFLIRAPRENVEDVYRFLLRRQASRTQVRFCLDEDDDIILKAELPVERLSAEELDRVVGGILDQHEGTFSHLLHLGFASFFKPKVGSTAG